MKIEFTIPSEYEKDAQDRFQNALSRAIADLEDGLNKGTTDLTGKYEIETLTMLRNMLAKARVTG